MQLKTYLLSVYSFIVLLILNCPDIYAQQTDSTKAEKFSFHTQATIINQEKAGFEAPYSGDNSLITEHESKTSITSTLYAGAKLWKGASIYINPEIAGGSGLSGALGIAAAANGETFRVGDPSPKIYLARIFMRQLFSLSKETVYEATDFNQLGGYVPVKYVSVTVGKIGLADLFDDNEFSHDPRTQFMSWGLMDCGAWDYAANTRGYTPSVALEYVSPVHELRYCYSLVPLTANGNDMNWDLSKAGSHSIEYTHHHAIKNKKGSLRLLAYFTSTNMGSYRQSLTLNPENPDITATRKYGHTKFGFVINADQYISDNMGLFLRAGWNDGNNETWAFTEIDRSISYGISYSGKRWKRAQDHIGLAYVLSGLSDPHRDYLKAGGSGFILGDGKLNYAIERLMEWYYAAELKPNSLYLTGAYQILYNPGYNKDRTGPVHIFSVRLHMRM